MTEYVVKQGGQGEGGTLPTLRAAADVARPGDIVIVHEGVYRERLLPPAGTVWQAASGESVVIHGGWDATTDVGDNQPGQVLITAADVTIEGFEVRNAPGDSIAVGKGGHNATIRNCRTDVAYSGGIILNAGEMLRGVTVDSCVVTRSGMGWVARGRRGIVSGAINLIRCEGARVKDTISAYNWGEGLNVGKGTKKSFVAGCLIFDNAHFCLGVNRAQDCVVEGNLLFLSGFERYQVGNENWPTGLVIGDETGYGGDAFAPSRGIRVIGNVIVNAGIGIGVRNGTAWDSYDTQLVGTAIEHNTVICGPLTRVGINIGENPRGRPHQNSVVRRNVVDTSGAAAGVVVASGDSRNVAWQNNAWGRQPAAAFRHAEDIVGVALVNATAALANEFPAPVSNADLDNYRPRAGSPVAAAGLGALAPLVDDPPPPPDPEPGPVDWAALRALVAEAAAELVTASMANDRAARSMQTLDARMRECELAAEGGEE